MSRTDTETVVTDKASRHPQEFSDVEPRIKPFFDPGFRPLSLEHRRILSLSGKRAPVRIGIERENGFLSTFSIEIPASGRDVPETLLFFVERIIKFLLWSRGGWKIILQAPPPITRHIEALYVPGGKRFFDAGFMSRVYGKPFEVVSVEPGEFPFARENASCLGGHFGGCRIGFDLGASDLKFAAVRDGRLIFSEEIPWNPGEQADPDYHQKRIRTGLKKAASHLPRVDAIGGSSAGIIIDNQVRIASLFRSIKEDVFESRIKDIFRRLKAEWDVPFEVVNDGEVAALAGTLFLGKNAMLGIAMGSSQAAGFLDASGRIPGWLDELAFVPLDANPKAAMDEWSGDSGLGADSFSHRAVHRLQSMPVSPTV